MYTYGVLVGYLNITSFMCNRDNKLNLDYRQFYWKIKAFIGIYAQTIKYSLINGQSHLPKSSFGQSIRKTRANKTDFSQWSSHLPVYDLYIWKKYYGHI